MKKILFLKAIFKNVAVLILVLFLTNCQDRDDVVQESNHDASQIHKDKIKDYWHELKKGLSKDQVSHLDELLEAVDINSLKIYDLRTTEKLLIADIRSLEGLEGVIKIVFYFNENQIVRSDLATLNSSKAISNYNKVIFLI